MLDKRDLKVLFAKKNGRVTVSIPPLERTGVSAELSYKSKLNECSLEEILEHFLDNVNGQNGVKEDIQHLGTRLRDEILETVTGDIVPISIDALISFLPEVFMYGVSAGRIEGIANGLALARENKCK